MTGGAHILIASSGCLSTGPRVVKEADALTAAGHTVHVAVCHWMSDQAESDARLARDRAWTWSAVDVGTGLKAARPAVWLHRVLERGALAVRASTGPLTPVDELAASRFTGPLTAHLRHLSASRAPRIVIAHNLAALPAAARLARARDARLGFDAEDDHFGELPAAEQRSGVGQARDAVLARYLPRCDYVSAASPGIAEALTDRYGIAAPTVLYNVFPWALRRDLAARPVERRAAGPALHWYSQTLGLDRGLQDAIRALSLLPEPVTLHVRGRDFGGARAALATLAEQVGVTDRLRFEATVHPDELFGAVAMHDIGLSLEQPVNDNRLAAVPNKLFFYLVAGLAVAATDVPGQRRVMETLPDAGVSYPPGDHEALAHVLGPWARDPERLARAKRAALQAAETTWCWERAHGPWLEAVETAMRRSG